MFYIPVVLGSIRRNRESIKAARFVLRSLQQRAGIETEMVDLKEFDLPMMEERLRFRDDAGPNIVEFSAKMARASSILIVTPEYSGGYPGVACLRMPLTISVLNTGGSPLGSLRSRRWLPAESFA